MSLTRMYVLYIYIQTYAYVYLYIHIYIVIFRHIYDLNAIQKKKKISLGGKLRYIKSKFYIYIYKTFCNIFSPYQTNITKVRCWYFLMSTEYTSWFAQG